MEIKVPEYYNFKAKLADEEKSSMGEYGISIIDKYQELAHFAYNDGYETGFNDGVESLEGGAING